MFRSVRSSRTVPVFLLAASLLHPALPAPPSLQGQTTSGPPATLALADATVSELAAAMDAGTLTAERLVELSLARIEAYDRAGPRLNAVLWLNRGALESARALDVERREQGPRSLLHGIPVVLKDNIDTADLPTTAGSLLLAGSIPPDDAFIVRKLREAGAIVLAKVNMSEFAGGAVMSSISGPMRNPHDPLRTPSGSSGGTGVAVAAWYAPLGIGTDTGGSIRGPSTSNGIVGLKPTLGLLSRDGIVPLSLTFDTAGPMARTVFDVAVMLGAMTGVDPADPATGASQGRAHSDYTAFLDADALRGARIGIARDFMGTDADVDWVVEAALATMRRAGATVVEVRYPAWFLEAKADWYTTIRWPDFREQIEDYLATLRPGYPRTLADLIVRSKEITSPTPMGGMPNPVRWSLFEREEASGSTSDPGYLAMRDHGLPLARGIVEGILAGDSLDAIVYPTSSTRPALAEGGSGGSGGWTSATNIANLTGFPDLVVPAGFVGGNLPVGISFFGPAFSEPRLLALGYAFEQATRARRRPTFTPALPGEEFQPAPPGGER